SVFIFQWSLFCLLCLWCTEIFVPLIDCQGDAPLTPAAPAASKSPEPLALFSEDGICLVDGDWSMDYWDPYGLDASLRDNVAPTVGLAGCVWAPSLESGKSEMDLVPAPFLEAVGALPSAAVLTQPGCLTPQGPTDATGDAIPVVWGELYVIDKLLFQMGGVNIGSILLPPAVRLFHPSTPNTSVHQTADDR
ncbi:unnamed protein product, partial [Timema podura]|nr:unnamed protein product [Timema podura]